jgi:hypothetical protein
MVSEGSIHGCLLHALGQNILVVRVCGRDSVPHEGQEADSQTERDQGQDTPKDSPQVTYFPHLGPTSKVSKTSPK